MIKTCIDFSFKYQYCGNHNFFFFILEIDPFINLTNFTKIIPGKLD